MMIMLMGHTNILLNPLLLMKKGIFIFPSVLPIMPVKIPREPLLYLVKIPAHY